jgi:superfamily II DNA or RNA helicase
MRIIVLDPGFKEGIDVFDVKYMHLLEPLVTKAEQTQVIGRGTRFCGQAGLSFIPNKGWPLHVYRYNMMYDDNTNVHELYLKYSNQNISALNFIADLEDLVVTSAVDLPLTEKIHMLDKKNNRFYN